MKIERIERGSDDFPAALARILDPPKQIFVLGDLQTAMRRPRLAVVGSRKASSYGLQVTTSLTSELAAQGIVIVSGLALGIDGAAHKAALRSHGLTVAVLAGGLDQIHPSTHRQLALTILEQGGALISEHPEGTPPLAHQFIARNRLIAGLSDGVLIPEAAAKSGSLHTAGFALDQGKVVMAVPGNITNLNSAGTNNLIKTGATPVSDSQHVLDALGLEEINHQANKIIGRNAQEQAILELLAQGVIDAAELCVQSKLDTAIFNQTLTMLELTGRIKPLGAGHWCLR